MDTVLLIAGIMLALVPAMTLHEAAHAYAAKWAGDTTAYDAGRLSLNPWVHVDVKMTLLLPLVMMVIGILLFGLPVLFAAAKPVPFDPRNFRSFRRDLAIVALAGPASNFVIGWFFALLAGFTIFMGYGGTPEEPSLFIQFCALNMFINAILMVFNLIPIPPLDGSRVVTAILPARLMGIYNSIEPYGIIILIVLLLMGGFQYIVPLLDGAVKLWAMLTPFSV